MKKIISSNLKGVFKTNLILKQQLKYKRLFLNKKKNNYNFTIKPLKWQQGSVNSLITLRNTVEDSLKELKFKNVAKTKKEFLSSPALLHRTWGKRLSYLKNPLLCQGFSYEYELNLSKNSQNFK